MFQGKSYNSYKELEKDSIENGFAIYGDLDEYSNKFESILLPNKDYICGLVYYNHGINSQVLLLDGTSKLLVGFEKTIIGLDYVTKMELIQKKSISLFYEFIEIKSYILAICELDIYVFDLGCRLIWSSGFRDVIEEYNVLNGERVTIRCSNGDKSVFDLKDGSVL